MVCDWERYWVSVDGFRKHRETNRGVVGGEPKLSCSLESVIFPVPCFLYLRKKPIYSSKISSTLSKISCSLQHGWIRVKTLNSPVFFNAWERWAGETQSKSLKGARREKARYIKDFWTMPDQKWKKIQDQICFPYALQALLFPSRQRPTSFYAKSINMEN